MELVKNILVLIVLSLPIRNCDTETPLYSMFGKGVLSLPIRNCDTGDYVAKAIIGEVLSLPIRNCDGTVSTDLEFSFYGFKPTYKELRPRKTMSSAPSSKVLSLPIRNCDKT